MDIETKINNPSINELVDQIDIYNNNLNSVLDKITGVMPCDVGSTIGPQPTLETRLRCISSQIAMNLGRLESVSNKLGAQLY